MERTLILVILPIIAGTILAGVVWLVYGGQNYATGNPTATHLLSVVNAVRKNHGLSPLTENHHLDDAALSETFGFKNGYDYELVDVVRSNGYVFLANGSVSVDHADISAPMDRNPFTALDVINAMLYTKETSDPILNPDYVHTGIAVVDGYYVQIFATAGN